MTENLSKFPAKGILRKSSLTFIEHDDSEAQIMLDTNKPTKVIVEPIQTPPREYAEETDEEKAKREEFELKRKLLQHQEAMNVQLAKRLLSDENIEEEIESTTQEEDDDDGVISDGSDAQTLDAKDQCQDSCSKNESDTTSE